MNACVASCATTEANNSRTAIRATPQEARVGHPGVRAGNQTAASDQLSSAPKMSQLRWTKTVTPAIVPSRKELNIVALLQAQKNSFFSGV